MDRRKNNNSILFLTTLGVYLGLVLVGATPVLGHAALTRNFELQDEIEVTDDLDKKPNDDAQELGKSIEGYFKDLEDFVQDLQKLHRIEKFDLDYDTFSILSTGFVPCDVDGDPVRQSEISKNIDNRWIEPAITDALYASERWNNHADCVPSTKFKTKPTATDSTFDLSLDKSELRYEISFSKKSAESASDFFTKLSHALRQYEFTEEDELLIKVLHRKTATRSVKNQVFIVTRLPRASIDSLIATDAK